jgi:hypothetical protein
MLIGIIKNSLYILTDQLAAEVKNIFEIQPYEGLNEGLISKLFMIIIFVPNLSKYIKHKRKTFKNSLASSIFEFMGFPFIVRYAAQCLICDLPIDKR